MIQNIGVLTSGGDSPGMNACVRAIVRTAIYNKLNVFGIYNGYQGIIDGNIHPLNNNDVANIIQRGGTILKTARSAEFRTKEGMQKAYENLKKHNIDAFVVIGGDGSCRGALEFKKHFSIPSMATPGTIDNDLSGTDYTIGFDTAVNTAVDAIDKIRDTADSHNRVFIVEVMGRDAGYIALHSGIACGAENIIIPEQIENIDSIIDELNDNRKRKKLCNILVVAEGDEFGGGLKLYNYILEKIPNLDLRISILGHIQRGGTPTCSDRILASRVGHSAVEALLQGRSMEMVGIINGEIAFTPYENCVKEQIPMKEDMIRMIKELAS